MRVETLLQIRMSALFTSIQSGGFYYLTTDQQGYHDNKFFNIEEGNGKTNSLSLWNYGTQKLLMTVNNFDLHNFEAQLKGM